MRSSRQGERYSYDKRASIVPGKNAGHDRTTGYARMPNIRLEKGARKTRASQSEPAVLIGPSKTSQASSITV